MVKRSILAHILLLALSACIVLATPLLLPVNIDSFEEFQDARFGLPFPYVKQNLLNSGASGYEGGFPHKFKLQLDFLDNDPEIEIIKANLVYSVGVVYGVFLINYYFLRKKHYKLK